MKYWTKLIQNSLPWLYVGGGTDVLWTWNSFSCTLCSFVLWSIVSCLTEGMIICLYRTLLKLSQETYNFWNLLKPMIKVWKVHTDIWKLSLSYLSLTLVTKVGQLLKKFANYVVIWIELSLISKQFSTFKVVWRSAEWGKRCTIWSSLHLLFTDFKISNRNADESKSESA